MAQEQQLAHRVIANTALAYITNTSPTNTEPHYISGSKDIVTSMNNFAERRPGFATNVEPTPTTFNNLVRLFPWDRFDGTFYIMACDINAAGFAQVFKLAVGSDASFVSIYTDTTAVPFDFVVSNNTVYFSNKNVAKKWTPSEGINNWGIAIGSVNNAVGPSIAGNGADGGGAHPWTNPNNVTSPALFATVTLATPVPSNSLKATQFGFAIPNTSTILGIKVTFDAQQSNAALILPGVQLSVTLLRAGSATGETKHVGSIPTTPTTYNLGSTSDMWFITWLPNDVDQTTFGVVFTANNPSGLSTTFSVRNVNITIYSLGGPTIVVSGGAGTMTATAGYQYVFCYGNSITGHISSPTPASASTGVFTNKLNVQVSLTASTDPQVNQIRVFRTTDGGGGTYFELPTSPYNNTTGNITDNSPDEGLNVLSIAPTANFNDPPTPGLQPVYFSGRIWLFKDNKVYFSGLEEINQGVPEESFPSGNAGNFWSFDEPVQGEGVAGQNDNQTLVIFCGGRFYGITGNTLDTFRRFQISKRRGTRSLTTVAALGGMLGWLDTSTQLWATDGNSLQELAMDIRPDLESVTPTSCSMTFHVAGRFHWCVFSTGSLLYVYDMDNGQWMPPWTFAARYIISGETAAGSYQLLASNGTKALQLNPNAFNDNGSTYQPVLKTNLMSVIPEFTGQGGSYNEPSRTGYPTIFQITNNGFALADVSVCFDDDPTVTGYTSIAANIQDTATTFHRVNGSALKQLVYPTNSTTSRWVSLQVRLALADQDDKIYEMFMGYKQFGGR